MKVVPVMLPINKLIKELGYKQNSLPNFIIPKFQRDLTWDESKINELYKSIDNKKPIGAITLYKHKPRQWLIIDGQQRLSSIYKLNINKMLSKQNKKYKVPCLYWESRKKDINIADFFVAINKNGSPLDKNDITLTMLSQEFINTPDWDVKKNFEKIEQMYKKRNSILSNNFANDWSNKISILEALWLFSTSIKSYNNHDKYIMGYRTQAEKSNKIKMKLLWMLRILSLICMKKTDQMNYHHNKKEFVKKIKNQINNIFSSKDHFNSFINKLNAIFIEFENKFSFLRDIPTQKKAIISNVKNKAGIAKDYMPIYILQFIYKNKKIFKNNINLKKISNLAKSYKITGTDILSFMVMKPIAAGGFDTSWLEYIVNQPTKMFHNYSTNANDTLANNIIEQSNNKDSFNPIAKVAIYWLVDKNFEHKIKGKTDFYEIDHIVPSKYCKEYLEVNYGRLGNCDILPSEDNRDKNSQLTSAYIKKSLINKHYQYNYNEIKNKIKKWHKNNNKINQDEFIKFIRQREKFIKKAIITKINKDSK